MLILNIRTEKHERGRTYVEVTIPPSKQNQTFRIYGKEDTVHPDQIKLAFQADRSIRFIRSDAGVRERKS